MTKRDATTSLKKHVFDACDQLWESTDGQFTNNDVLAISKGGEAVTDQLRNVSSSAEAAQVQISEMVSLLAELQTLAHNLKSKE